jgi:hypothetical protein
VLAFAVTAGSVTSPGTAYAKHGDGAAIALGIIGGALAGAAIASSVAPGYYAAPPSYYYLCAAGLLCRASAALFLRTSARCVLCSGAVLRAGILLQWILNATHPSLACLVSRSLWRGIG